MVLKKLDTQRQDENSEVAEFEKLFKAHYKSLCIAAFNIVKDLDTAEEIVQEFFYNYWKNRKSIYIKTSIGAYFYRSVYNSSLKHLRSATVRQKHTDYIKRQGNADNNDASQELEAKELWKIIERTLDELPERYAIIFRMSRFEAMKYREIAEKLSVSVKTVEAAMGKALAAFRKNLSDYHENRSYDKKQTKMTDKIQ